MKGRRSVKYSVAFLGLAGAAVGAGWSIEGVAAWGIAMSAAVAFGLTAWVYAVSRPGMLLKRATGRRPVWAWVLYWPYFVLNGLSMGLFRMGEKRPAFVEVVPGLYLGRRLSEREACRAGLPEWRAVLDLTAEFPETRRLRGMAYRSMPVLDASAPSLEELAEAVDWLKDRVEEGPVYVHCALGHGRSASVVVGYLMATGKVGTVEEGVAFVREKRPGVRLVKAQEAVLRRYAGTVQGEVDEDQAEGRVT